MEDGPRIRRLIEVPVGAAGIAAFERRLSEFEATFGEPETTTTEGGSMEQDRMDEMVAERVERNRRWGRDTSRDTALAELTNEGEVPMWEERQPVQPRSRPSGAVEVRDDF